MNGNDLEKIMARYQSGKISDEEKVILEDWILYGYFDDVSCSQLQLNAALSEIEIKLPLVKKKVNWLLPLTTAAAVLIFMTGIFFFRGKFDEDYLLSNASKNIKPGGNSATLVLANGKRINLNAVKVGELRTENEIRISKTADGNIIYKINEVKSAQDANGTGEAFNTIEVPVGGQYQIQLSDGSKVWLNAKSSLRFPLKFIGKDRSVELNGEGYFEVAHLQGKSFRVKSNNQSVEVLGTHFNVSAYTEDHEDKVTLIEGSVRVQAGSVQRVLIPGQQSKFGEGNLQVADVDVNEAIAWKNGYFRFNDNLSSIMSEISRWYNVEVVYEAAVDRSQMFEGEISRSRNIAEILRIIQSTGNVKFKIEGRRVTVKQ